jgi:ribosomal protein S18 acetylase RimI-like enzyme
MISICPARPDDSSQAAFLIRLTMGGTADAIRLYQRFGFQIVHRDQYPGSLAAVEGGYYRMVKELK